MSFLNVAKTGVENFSKYGKLIGEGKNNGIKVYEQVRADGRKTLHSLNKDGEVVKIIQKEASQTESIDLVNHTTSVMNRNKISPKLNGGPTQLVYDYKKTYKDPVDVVSMGLKRSYSSPEFVNFSFSRPNDPALMGIMRSNKAKDYVKIYEKMADGSAIELYKNLREGRAVIKAEGNYNLTPEIVLPRDLSTYNVGNDGLLTHANAGNKIEQNLAQMFFDSAKKLWS